MKKKGEGMKKRRGSTGARGRRVKTLDERGTGNVSKTLKTFDVPQLVRFSIKSDFRRVHPMHIAGFHFAWCSKVAETGVCSRIQFNPVDPSTTSRPLKENSVQPCSFTHLCIYTDGWLSAGNRWREQKGRIFLWEKEKSIENMHWDLLTSCT